jgi:hypothetical protein
MPRNYPHPVFFELTPATNSLIVLTSLDPTSPTPLRLAAHRT